MPFEFAAYFSAFASVSVSSVPNSSLKKILFFEVSSVHAPSVNSGWFLEGCVDWSKYYALLLLSSNRALGN